jgi:hypothetical protein
MPPEHLIQRVLESSALKLLDQVVQAKLPLDIEDASGRYQLPGAGELADSVKSCPTRFVADANVVAYCGSLLTTDRGMLEGRNEFLRLPAEALWLEWPSEVSEDPTSGSRTGVLVSAGRAGRSGQMITIWEQADGEPVAGQMTASFDLDDDLYYQSASNGACALRPGSHPLAPHLIFEVRPEWERHFNQSPNEEVVEAASRIIATIMRGVEFLFVFSALLAERACLRNDEVDLSRLNRQRIRKGKIPLLNHVEVRLDLALEPSRGSSGLGGDREPARLHSVRGHMVTRAGRTFWRRSHLRGDPSRAGWVRTVYITRGLS